MTDVSAVDTMCNLFTDTGMNHFEDSGVRTREVFDDPDIFQDAIRTPEEFAEMMDEVGVASALIPAIKLKDRSGNVMDVDIPYEDVHEVTSEHPDRFKGIAGLNPHDGMDGVHEFERAVEELDFIGAIINPHSFGIPLNHRKWYPFYAKAAELDVPVTITTGYTHGYSRNELGRPSLVEDVALDFPDLTLVAAHTGWPWTGELVPIAWTNPNVYLGATAYAPYLWDDELVDFIKYRGTDKVVWGSDYPVTKYEKVFPQFEEVGLEEEHVQALLQDNPREVFDVGE